MNWFDRYIRCPLTGGHRWTQSQSVPGHYTCVRCRLRRSAAWIARHRDALFDR